MKSLVLTINVFLCVLTTNGTMYGFFRDVNKNSFNQNTRRIFGGDVANIRDFPGTCLLVTQDKKGKCTGYIITQHFVVTAAHCINPYLRWIYYNNRLPRKGNVAKVHRIYQHPKFDYKVENEGHGDDVTQLYHDIGLVESNQPMSLAFLAHMKNPIQAMRDDNIMTHEVDVLGFGITESTDTEELLWVKLIINRCDRSTWLYCACGQAGPGQRARGVCSGDSGGPVILNGSLVGVTSMGPVECATSNDPSLTASSVFTIATSYIDLIDNTINYRANSQKMTEMRLSSSSSSSPHSKLSDEARALISRIYSIVFVLALLQVIK